MTFREKIDKILRVNKLGINSPSGLETFIKAGTGAITKYYKIDEEPGEGTIKKILEVPGLSASWWETGQGPVFIVASGENHTHDDIEAAIPEKSLGEERPIRLDDIIEGNSHYSIVPNTLISGEYRMILDKDINWRMQIITSLVDAKNDTIKDLRERLERAEKEMEQLRSRPRAVKQRQK